MEKMKNKSLAKIGAALLMIVLAAAMLAGCGQPSTLEEAIQQDKDAKSQIEKIADENKMDISVKKNTVNYTVKLDSEVDDSLVDTYKSALKEAFKGEEDSMKSSIKDLESETKIDGIKYKIIVQDSTGKEVYTCTFTKDGMD
ncbi:MAG: DUF4854 domain-containing protein [Eubacteriales bacterium]|nr:DUF4854 domain-containing protein [Eubacteriales bacterium]